MKKKSKTDLLISVEEKGSVSYRPNQLSIVKTWISAFAGMTTVLVVMSCISGCNPFAGYSNDSLHRGSVRTVYLEMFDNSSFRRGIEYELTDALGKQIEAKTPYKIVTDRNRADTLISGYISSADEGSLTVER